MMRVLIFGAGSIGRRHMRNIVSLCSNAKFFVYRTTSSQDDLKASFDVTFFSNMDELFDLDIDFAVISSPSFFHYETATDMLSRGVPFYMEKPLCINKDELSSLKQCLSDKGEVISLMGCNLRYLPSIARLKELVDHGAIGRIVRANLQVGQWLPDWRKKDYLQTYSADSNKGGGVFLDLIHEIDVANWLFGPFLSAASAKSNQGILGIDAEECASALLVSEKGPIVTVSMDYISRVPVRCYEVVGEDGTLVWNYSRKELKLITANCTETILSGGPAFDMNQTYISAMSELMGAIEKNSPTNFGIEDGLDTMGLALTLKEAALL